MLNNSKITTRSTVFSDASKCSKISSDKQFTVMKDDSYLEKEKQQV